jgi:thiamine pyrophosphate-dependent acetolactate synthase large subunit-like protein
LSPTIGDFIVQHMHEWGVRRIFGYPGDGINGVFGALNRAPDKITFVQARHEEMIGLKGIYFDDPERLGPACDEASAARRPVVLEVKTDPDVPPLPPHITLDQAKIFSQSLAKGDSRTGEIVAGAARQLLSAILPDHQD